MDIIIKYWCSEKGKAETRYFDSQFLRRPNAENLVEKLKVSLKQLDTRKCLQLSMDGPNTNWLVLEMWNEERIKKKNLYK